MVLPTVEPVEVELTAYAFHAFISNAHVIIHVDSNFEVCVIGTATTTMVGFPTASAGARSGSSRPRNTIAP
jgi:hypothetical protein